MPSPFPGMNPYFENPELWPGVHHWLIIEIANALNRQLSDRYVVAVQVQMYETSLFSSRLIAIDDDLAIANYQTSNKRTDVAVPIGVNVPILGTIKQGYLEVKQVGTGEVITTIELLSYVNKQAGKGREQYEDKRQTILDGSTHMVEIDLLRKGGRMEIIPDGIKSDYRILVSPKKRRPQADLYAFNVREAIPGFPLPLRPEDREPVLDLTAVIDEIYDERNYARMLDYSQDPVPSLSATDAVWAEKLLRDRGLR